MSKPKAQTPEELIEKHIQRAWIAAVISASMTLLLVLLAIGGVQILAGLNAWGLLDVVILSGFAFGIYKRSRVCAILLLAYAVFNEIYMMSQDSSRHLNGLSSCITISEAFWRSSPTTNSIHLIQH